MAAITLGLGTSHTPMLLVDAADLPRYEENDRRLTLLGNDGTATTFDTLQQQAGGRHAAAITPDALTQRHAAAQRGLDRLAESLATAAPDVLVIIGDDQQEMLRGTDMPPLLVYTEPVIRSARPAHPPNRPAWVLRATDRYYPADGPVDYPVHTALAGHILETLQDRGIAARAADTRGAPMGHAFAFVCSQLMRRRSIPLVPILLNALYPPTQPTPADCLHIGRILADAIGTFAAPLRVGIVASGGLSHFVVDEHLDRAVVQAVTAGDSGALSALPAHRLNSGSGEIRNWICAAGALDGIPVEQIDYFPGYRTQAGTGTGLCFAVWRPA